MNSVAEWLQTNDQMCLDIVDRKYLLDEDILGHKETIDELLDRVSGGYYEARKLMEERKFIPGGRIIANRGLQKYGLKITYSNCYVNNPPEDNIESIYNTCAQLARTFSYGGGCGIDLSKLSPAGAKVNNTARKSTGAISFVNTFSEVSETIGQNGRRAALMLSIDAHHPDLCEFITHKSDLGVTQGANMSVRVDNDFFDAVENDKDWTMSFTRKETDSTVTKTVKARDIMRLIAKTNWDFAEPGMLYWDTITKYNLMSEDHGFEYAGTNPCVTGDTLILTEFGYYPIGALVGQKVNIWNGYEWSEVVPRITGTNQSIMQIDFSDGSSIKCTNYHKFIMSSGEDVRVEAKDLKVGDCICKTEFPIIEGSVFVDDKIMYTKGFLVGDGTIDSRGRNIIYLYEEKMNLLSYIDYDKFWDQTETSNRYCLQLDKSKYILMADKYYVPTSYDSISSRLSWLAGYMDADGTVNSSSGSISITSINKVLLEEVKLMLNTLGCTGVIGICNSERTAVSPDGNGGYKDYHCSTSYSLTISAFYVNKLMQLGLRTHRLQLYSATIKESSKYPQIVNITNLGIAPVVYCVTDELRNSVVFGGIRTANCGEEPLPAGGSCLLGAMNLSMFWKDGKFDSDEFIKDVKVAVRYLNEVLDEGMPLHPLRQQRDTVHELRQIGLGFMGLGDLFVQAKMAYGSIASIDLCHQIGYKMIFAALQESAKLAKEKGCFAACKPELIIKSEFYKQNVYNNPYFSEQDKDKLTAHILTYGLRNSQLLTCAPTGTTSTIFNVSGGIEPIFALKFTRTTKSIYEEDRTYEVYPRGIKYFLDENGYTSLSEVKEFPSYLVTARDINWKDRINVQAAWQAHIDASISATINLPEETTVEEIEHLYIYAHMAGLKGVTVYRENCKRTGILHDSYKKKKDSNEEKQETTDIKNKDYKDKETEIYIESVKNIFKSNFSNILTRSDFSSALHGTTYYKRVACGHIYITVNRYQGRPVEVFMQSSKSGGCSANTEALGRMASTMLRAGIDADIVVDSVLGVKCAACSAIKGKGERIDGMSCSDVMARVIQEEYQRYNDGVYDNEIEEWLSTASYEEKHELMTTDTDSKKSIGVNTCSYISCKHWDQCSDSNRYDGCCGPDDPGEEGDLGVDQEYDYKEHSTQENIDNYVCPECGTPLITSEGCIKCINCGFSKC